MPLLSFKCPVCSSELEELVKSWDEKPICPKCGSEMVRCFSGKCYGSIGAGKGAPSCSHNCATCKGCDKQ
ncbi:MAG: zinc ribbon domain-containing protein [Clostridia bacterium]|nr:zinc ribbon domain-containing protein [Clostridia bacterium]